MGASNSRRLTFANDEPHIIEVTQDVVSRLRAGSAAKPTPAPAFAQPPTQTHPQTTPPSPLVPAPDKEQQNMSTTITNPVPPSDPLALSVNSSGQQIFETVSAIQVRQQKDEELRKNDFVWRTKLRELETRYVNSAFASDQEFNTELEKLEKLVPKKKEPICKELSLKVSECYSTHPTQSLKCSDAVQEFKQCVQKSTTYTL